MESSETVVGPLKGHKGDVRSVAISNDGERVVSCSYDDTIRVWDLRQMHGPFKNDDQVPDTNGWVKGENGELVFWVPRMHRHSFYAPRNVIVIGRHVTGINYSRIRLGKDWKNCYTSNRHN